MASTARGLSQGGSRLHEFLFYRAWTLLKTYSSICHHQVIQCLKASFTLCRAKGDYEFSRQVLDSLNQATQHYSEYQADESNHLSSFELSDMDIKRILSFEIMRTNHHETSQKISRRRKKTRKSPKKTEQQTQQESQLSESEDCNPVQEMLW
jgi:hypothetical protein